MFSNHQFKAGKMRFHFATSHQAGESSFLEEFQVHKQVLGVIGISTFPYTPDAQAAHAHFTTLCEKASLISSPSSPNPHNHTPPHLILHRSFLIATTTVRSILNLCVIASLSLNQAQINGRRFEASQSFPMLVTLNSMLEPSWLISPEGSSQPFPFW